MIEVQIDTNTYEWAYLTRLMGNTDELLRFAERTNRDASRPIVAAFKRALSKYREGTVPVSAPRRQKRTRPMSRRSLSGFTLAGRKKNTGNLFRSIGTGKVRARRSRAEYLRGDPARQFVKIGARTRKGSRNGRGWHGNLLEYGRKARKMRTYAWFNPTVRQLESQYGPEYWQKRMQTLLEQQTRKIIRKNMRRI